jgi:metal-sulfur cluster biosynthetic enzyme
MGITAETIQQALATVIDVDTGKDIVTMKSIKNLQINRGNV